MPSEMLPSPMGAMTKQALRFFSLATPLGMLNPFGI